MASYLGGAFKDFCHFHICFIDTWGNGPQFEEPIFFSFAWLVQPPEVWYWMNSMNPNLGNSRCVK